VIAYHLLKDRMAYQELGHDYFDRRDTGQLQRRLIGRLEALGLRVTVEPLPQAA
jgi:transposase